MKRILHTLLLVFLSQFLFAQSGDIVKEDRVWSNLLENCEPDITYYTTFFHRFEGDTIIANKTYLKVIYAEDELAQEWSFTNEYVREENGRVFYLSDPEEREVLIYDFNLHVGEKVKIWNHIIADELTLTLENVDSVMTLDGYRKRWGLIVDEFSPPEIWIEGVGSESGVLNSGTGIFLGLCGTYSLLCSTDAGIQVYQNPDYETCYYNLLDDQNDNLTDNNGIEIFYQPAKKKVLIKNSTSANSQIIITNISGTILYNKPSDEFETSISTQYLPSGLFIITVMGKNRTTSKKIIISKLF